MSAYLLGSILVFLVVCLPLIFIGLMAPIAEWLNAREDRKKAEAAAKAAVADGTTAGVASPSSTVAPSAPSSTPEPA